MTLSIEGYSYRKKFETDVVLSELFSPFAEMECGIQGVVNAGGKIKVTACEKETNVIVCQITLTTTSSSHVGVGTDYTKQQLGEGATYYP